MLKRRRSNLERRYTPSFDDLKVLRNDNIRKTQLERKKLAEEPTTTEAKLCIEGVV